MSRGRQNRIEIVQNRFVSSDAVQHLVSDVLGCACPPEVFESIIVGRPAIFKEWRLPGTLQILVGWRLLVSVVNVTELQNPLKDSIEMLREGRAVRDAYALNRFRLALVGDLDESVVRRLEETIEAMDERIHVHNLPFESLGQQRQA